MYMSRCLDIAKRGLGCVSPNPLVGAVLVVGDRIIGEGWHQEYGHAHAEVNAVAAVSDSDRPLLEQATLYVNLEPCNHHGKTPPCVDLILTHKIPKVIVCNVDSNPLVGGKGIARLRENGVEVLTGVLEKEGRVLNRRFFTMIERKRPYVILKYAQTKDGFFAKNDDQQHWITTPISKQLVHLWRSQEDAILVGKRTALIDNPKLSNRFFAEDLQPLRVVIDRELEVPQSHFVYDQSLPTLIVNAVKNDKQNNIEFLCVEFEQDFLQQLLTQLYKRNIQSILIEGGATTLQYFIAQNLWDEARVLTGSTSFQDGIKAPIISGSLEKEFSLGSDLISIYTNCE